MTLKNFTIGFLMLIAIGLSMWSIIITRESTKTSSENISNRPDALMEDIVATIINDDGSPVLKVVAPKVIHYVENDATDMTQPHITVYRKDSPSPWFINANRAKATKGIDQIVFQDQVTIHHPTDTHYPTTIMHTNSLTVFPEQQLAQTKEAIIINQPESTIHAIGMLANLNDGTVKLLSETREEYAPGS